MSWIILNCADTIKVGDVLSFDETSNVYNLANDMGTPIYVALTDARVAEDSPSGFDVKAQAQGQVRAKSSRDILDQGGFMSVENGKVYVDNNNVYSSGIIWNVTKGYPSRIAGDLVTITLR
jgi:hypothetical protein